MNKKALAVFVIGIALTITGFALFLVPFGVILSNWGNESMSPDIVWSFIYSFVGMPLMIIGSILSGIANKKLGFGSKKSIDKNAAEGVNSYFINADSLLKNNEENNKKAENQCKRCPKCGKENDSDAKFCKDCGEELKD